MVYSRVPIRPFGILDRTSMWENQGTERVDNPGMDLFALARNPVGMDENPNPRMLMRGIHRCCGHGVCWALI